MGIALRSCLLSKQVISDPWESQLKLEDQLLLDSLAA